MNLEPRPKDTRSNTLQALAKSAASKPAGPSNKSNGGNSRGRAESSRTPGAGRIVVLFVALGVVSVIWGVHRQWSKGSAAPDAQARRSAVSRDGGALPAGPARSPFVSPASLSTAGLVAKALDEPPGPRSPAVPARTAASGEDVLLAALTAPQEDVRHHSLEQALGTGVDVPQDTLQDLLANDPSDGVRELALQGLTERPEASREEIGSILEAAVANPSAAVRASAQRMIEQMNALDQMDERAREFRRKAGAARIE